jgi:hypothetical protein
MEQNDLTLLKRRVVRLERTISLLLLAIFLALCHVTFRSGASLPVETIVETKTVVARELIIKGPKGNVACRLGVEDFVQADVRQESFGLFMYDLNGTPLVTLVPQGPTGGELTIHDKDGQRCSFGTSVDGMSFLRLANKSAEIDLALFRSLIPTSDETLAVLRTTHGKRTAELYFADKGIDAQLLNGESSIWIWRKSFRPNEGDAE